MNQKTDILLKRVQNYIIPKPFQKHNGELVSDFKQKANIFNNHFASQCTPIKNGSKLPNFIYKTEKRLISFDIKDDDILLIIKILNVNKAHGWDQLLKLVVIQYLSH